MAQTFCPRCGTASNGGNFCTNCGQPLAPAQVQPHSQQQAPAQPQNPTQQPKFVFPESQRQSDIITTDEATGEPVIKPTHLNPSAILLFFFQYLGRSAILLLLFAIAAYFEPILSGAITITYFILVYFIAYMNYRSYIFEVSTVAFRKEHGVFHKYSVNIAFDQIQNINMRRSIIDQALGLAHLEIETAGTGGAVKRNVGGLMTASEGYIPGISPKQATDLKTLVLARAEQS